MWFIGVEVEQETSAPPPKKNPGSAPVNGPNTCKTKAKYINFMFKNGKELPKT